VTGIDRWALRLMALGVFGILAMLVSNRLEAREPGGLVTPRCSATGDGISCTFSNTDGYATRACAWGVVTNKADPTKSAMSQQLCTGRLDGFETKTVTGHWLIGSPIEICSSTGQFGERLDWSQCEFTVKN
jgi:hypothetical protein